MNGERWRRDFNFYPVFSAMRDLNMILMSTLSDIARNCQTLTDYEKSRWRPSKPELEITIERGLNLYPIPTATPKFATTWDTSVALPLLTDVG